MRPTGPHASSKSASGAPTCGWNERQPVLLIIDCRQRFEAGALAMLFQFGGREPSELNGAKRRFEGAIFKWLHANVFQPLEFLRGEVAAVVSAAGFFAGQRAAGEHLGDEAEVFGVDRFVPRGVVDRAAVAAGGFDALADVLDFGEGRLHVVAVADDADFRPHDALHAVAELERVFAGGALEREQPAFADFLGLGSSAHGR
jgi:hypothetical protein